MITGTTPLVYTWRKTGSDMLLSSSSVLSRIVTSSDSGEYVCTVNNPRVAKSPHFTLPHNASFRTQLIVQGESYRVLKGLFPVVDFMLSSIWLKYNEAIA